MNAKGWGILANSSEAVLCGRVTREKKWERLSLDKQPKAQTAVSPDHQFSSLIWGGRTGRFSSYCRNENWGPAVTKGMVTATHSVFANLTENTKSRQGD